MASPVGSTVADPDDPETVGQRQGFAVLSLKLEAEDFLELWSDIAAGLDYDRLEMLQGTLDLSNEEAADVLGVSTRTLSRRREEGRLHEEESDRLVRLGRLLDLATVLFEGDAEAASRWFRRPNRALGGKSPLEVSRTSVGANEVENLVWRLEHGIVT